MPKMTFTDENRAKSQYDFTKLSFEHGERGRISTIEAEPEMEFVHTLRAPQIVNGKPVMEMQTFKTKGGGEEQKEVMKTDFIGQHICIGDINELSKNGSDVKGCPVCKASKESDAVEGAKRRFAMHVLRYKTQPGSFVIQDPFTVELVVWAFTDVRFNELIELTTEWGNLQLRDLNLGPCTGKQYQKFDINIANKCEWQASDARKEQVKLVYQNNKLEDLTVAIGRRLTKDQVEEDLDRVLTRYEIAMGRKEASVVDLGNQVDVGSLLGDDVATKPTEPTEETPATSPSGSSAELDGLNEFAQPDEAEADPEPAEEEEAPKDKGSMSLEAILNL